jgi:flagellar protein FliO/FliZ
VSAARRGWVFAAIPVAIAATAWTGEAFALAEPAPSAAPVDAPPPLIAAPPAASAAPLVVRPAPIVLAPDTPESGIGWKIVAFLALVGGGAYYLRKRMRPAGVADDGRLTIVRRTSIGIRSELLVVNVEGQRLLIGVTPNSIQSLAILDGDEPAPLARTAIEDEASGSSNVGERFAAILQAADAPLSGATRAEVASAEDDASMAGQARGLMALRRRG